MVIIVSVGGIILSLFMPCFALLVSWSFGQLIFSCYLCGGFERVYEDYPGNAAILRPQGLALLVSVSLLSCDKNGEITRKSNRAMLPLESLLLAVVF